MIKGLIRAVLINGVALFLASRSISGFHLDYSYQPFIIITLIFTAIHLFIKPLLNLILSSLNFLTFGLVSLVIDIAILYALSRFFPQVTFSRWPFPGFEYLGFTVPAYEFSPLGSTIASAVLINLVRQLLNYLAS